MEVSVGETQDAAFGLTFDRRLKLEFHGSTITSDGGLLACRELDDVLGLSEVAGEVLTDTRTGANGRHTLLGQFRQSVFGLGGIRRSQRCGPARLRSGHALGGGGPGGDTESGLHQSDGALRN